MINAVLIIFCNYSVGCLLLSSYFILQHVKWFLFHVRQPTGTSSEFEPTNQILNQQKSLWRFCQVRWAEENCIEKTDVWIYLKSTKYIRGEILEFNESINKYREVKNTGIDSFLVIEQAENQSLICQVKFNNHQLSFLL